MEPEEGESAEQHDNRDGVTHAPDVAGATSPAAGERRWEMEDLGAHGD